MGCLHVDASEGMGEGSGLISRTGLSEWPLLTATRSAIGYPSSGSQQEKAYLELVCSSHPRRNLGDMRRS